MQGLPAHSALSCLVGREDPEPGGEAHHGRPLRGSLQQAGQQGCAAGLGGQRHGDAGADRALRRPARAPRVQARTVRVVCSCRAHVLVNKSSSFF